VKAGGGQVSQLYEPPITRTQHHFGANSVLTEPFAGPNHRPDGLPVYDQAGLVLHAISAHSRADSEAD